ncbi:hypothetical protein GCM10027048_27560 [Hymenobacter coalescens]
MPDINQLHPLLHKAYTEAKAEYMRDYPHQPRPILTSTHRSKAEQNALYAQGREPLATINQLRKIAGLRPIGAVEARRKVTNARGGQSAHNYLPAMAFDVAFTKDDGKSLIWDHIHFHRFAPYVTKHVGIRWGGDWDGDGKSSDEKFIDLPHYEVRGWAQKM